MATVSCLKADDGVPIIETQQGPFLSHDGKGPWMCYGVAAGWCVYLTTNFLPPRM